MKNSKEYQNWNRLYWLQIVVLGAIIAILYWLTKYYS